MEAFVIICSILGGIQAAVWVARKLFSDKDEGTAPRFSPTQTVNVNTPVNVNVNVGDGKFSPANSDGSSQSAPLPADDAVRVLALPPSEVKVENVSERLLVLAEVLSIDEVLSTMKSNKLTQLRRESYAKQHQGKRVVWRCEMFSVEEVEGELFCGITPPGDPTLMAMARFPLNQKEALLLLDADDEVLIEGDLELLRRFNAWLVNAHFIRRIGPKPKVKYEKILG